MSLPPAIDPASLDEAERRFLAEYDVSEFERPSLTVDVVLLSVVDGQLTTLLVRRTEHPHKGRLALPGGFVGMRESLDAAAVRVLGDKVGLRGVFVEQLYTFGAPKRDPRTRVVTVAYYALVDAERFAHAAAALPEVQTLPVVVSWPDQQGGPVEVVDAEGRARALAFDHADVLGMAVLRLRGKLGYSPIGFQLLPECFTMRQLQRVHEVALGHTINKDSFRRRMIASGELFDTGQRQQEVGHRPAALYRFARSDDR